MIIYKANNLVNGKIYIGKTIQGLDKRKNQHIYDAFQRNTKMIFHKALRKYGKDNFKWEIIDFAENENELNEKETLWIIYYNSYIHNDNSNGYNMTLGGEGQSGIRYSEESRRKMSNSQYGKHHTYETKKKMSDTRKKNGTQKGSKNNMSKLTENDVIKIKQMLIDGVKEKEIANKFNITESSISNIKTGKRWGNIGKDLSTIIRKEKLTDYDVKEIKLLIKEGKMKQREIAKKFNISETNISDIKSGRSWKQVNI